MPLDPNDILALIRALRESDITRLRASVDRDNKHSYKESDE